TKGIATPSSSACSRRTGRGSKPSAARRGRKPRPRGSISSLWSAARIDVLAPAFPEPALASQAVFRAVMDALARPGKVVALPRAMAAPAPLSGTAAALACTLLDYETPVWLDATLSKAPQVAEWIRFNTGAAITADPQQASFAFIADPSSMLAFERFSLGTDE